MAYAPATAVITAPATILPHALEDELLNSGPAKPFEFPPAVVPSAAEHQSREIQFDVFISHKRSDAADLARSLKTELSAARGLRVFLDQDADFQLGDLMARVRQSAALVFILSSHVFESEWCLLELREALLWRLNVILLQPQGNHWMWQGKVKDTAAAASPELHAAPGHGSLSIVSRSICPDR